MMMGGDTVMQTEAVLEQISHLSPADVAALLVHGAAPAVPGADVRFCASSSCFAPAPRGRMRVHCIRWSVRRGASPPLRVPLVGDPLHAERSPTEDALLRISGAGAATLLAPHAHDEFVGVLRLFRGSGGTYGRATRRVHALWEFVSQTLSDGAAVALSDALTVELFSRKVVAWIFACFARLQVAPSRHVTLRQLEMAFPLLLALDAPERAALVGDAVTRLAGGLLTFYDDRVIARRAAPVSAAALLAPAELVAVTAAEHTSAAFVFRCQMRQDAALRALQEIADTWGQRKATSPSANIRRAVAALLSHAAGTCALVAPLRGAAATRAVMARNLPAMLLPSAEAIAARAVALLRTGQSSAARHRVALRGLLSEAGALQRGAAPPEAAEAPEAPGGFFESVAPEAGGFFESVLPAPQGAGVAWRVTAAGRHKTVPPPPRSTAAEGTEATPGALLLLTVLSAAPRIGFARPMLRVTASEAPALCLNMGRKAAAESSESIDEEIWRATRRRRRGADKPGV